MEIVVKEEGIFIPKKLLKGLEIEDAEVVLKEHEIRVKPKSLTRKFNIWIARKLLKSK